MSSTKIPFEITERIVKLNDLLHNDKASYLNIRRKFNLQNNENSAGIYAFWLLNSIDEELKLNKVVSLIGRDGNQKYTLWQDNDIEENNHKCLYIGWTDHITNQIDRHLMLDVKAWYKPIKNSKLEVCYNDVYKKHDNTDFIFMRNSDCRFRACFEHLFKRVLTDDERMEILRENIGISFFEILPDGGVYDLSINEAYYLKHLCLGYLRPWFNLNTGVKVSC